MNQSSRDEYTARINRVLDYIESHVDEDLTLESLAKIACFSPFHFHRVFGAMVGETLGQFVLRVRLEKAASSLLSHPKKSVTEVGLDCGFSSSAAFARAFRSLFGMTATDWRKGGHRTWEKQGEAQRRSALRIGDPSSDYGIITRRIDPNKGHPQWMLRVQNLDPVWLEVRELPALHVAYVRYTGPYQGMGEVFARLFARLEKWATPRGLLALPEVRWLAVYHDNPEITDDDKLRVTACLTVPPGTEVEGEIGTMTIEGGRYAVARFQLGEKDYSRAWYAVCGCWLPESGYEPDDRYSYELYHSNVDGICSVDICVPVRPL